MGRLLAQAKLPLEIRLGRDHSLNEILGVFDRVLPRRHGLRALEIGGAPGQYLAYLARTFGYEVSVLDDSAIGCEQARRNFPLLGLPLSAHHRDLFEDGPLSEPFDVVFSLGFIEHFTDLEEVIRRHVQLVKPGGILVVGCPNLEGINGWYLDRVAPVLLAGHYLPMMDFERWKEFEAALGLEPAP